MVCDAPLPAVIQSIADAKAHFSAIVDQASEGKVFVICRAGRHMATVAQYVAPSCKRRPDTLRGKIKMTDDFDAMPAGFAEAFA